MSKSFGDQLDKATFYCTTCPRLCRFSCPVAEAECRETVTPWGLMRLLELSRQEVVPLDEEVAQTFYHCTGCGKCQSWCLHDNDVPKAMHKARRWAYEQGCAPAVADEMVERFDHFSAPQRLLPLPDDPELSVEACFDAQAKVAFFPDCQTRERSPELVLRAGRLLERLLGHKVRLVTRLRAVGPGCCGFELDAVGAAEQAQHYRETQFWPAFEGVKLLITDCASLVAQQLDQGSFALEGAASVHRPQVKHIIEVLAEHIERVPPVSSLVTERVMLHDSCFVGRHLKLYEQTRKVAAALFDEPPAALSQSREQAQCCGAGHRVYAQVEPQGAAAAAESFLAQLEREGGQAVICGQAGCKAALNGLREDVAIDLLEAACMAYEV